ncbi:MAG: tRNA (adenosine(37)-N6)-dimethylallyltransferase MiaA [Cyclobacteriaceae bacterium]|nr:tRNA (adenosine(37)-N6)-dimethylallyltransferase MiaA [Cyclobacteriaceae bacterium]
MSTNKQKKIIVVIGATAVGKTKLCVSLAQQLNTVVISADSRQFYKEMNIGTAKPSLEEMEEVFHYFIDNKSITEEYNVGLYENEVIATVDQIFASKDVCVLTGGSGLYVDAVCNGIDEMPKVQESLREKLNMEYKQFGLNKLVKELEQSDPEYYKNVDVKNVQRVIRALEICRQTGKTYSSFRKNKVTPRPFQIIKIGLERDRDELYARIDKRMDVMIEQGLFKEVEGLSKYRHHNALQTVGYKEVFDYFDGLYDIEEAIRLLKRNSRRYAKRQMTWFRRDETIKWFHPENNKDIEKYINEQMEN